MGILRKDLDIFMLSIFFFFFSQSLCATSMGRKNCSTTRNLFHIFTNFFPHRFTRVIYNHKCWKLFKQSFYKLKILLTLIWEIKKIPFVYCQNWPRGWWVKDMINPRCLTVINYIRTDIESISSAFRTHVKDLIWPQYKLQMYKNGSYSITNIKDFLRQWAFWEKTKQKNNRWENIL